MAVSYIGEQGTAGESTVDISPSSTVPSGHLLVLIFAYASVTDVTVVTDTAGNSWFPDVSVRNGVDNGIAIFSSKLDRQLLITDVISVSAAPSGAYGILLEEFSGLGDSPSDNASEATGADSTSASVSLGILSQPYMLLIEASSPQASFRTFIKDAAFTSFTTVSVGRCGGAYRIVTNQNPINASCAWTGAAVNWSAGISSYLTPPTLDAVVARMRTRFP